MSILPVALPVLVLWYTQYGVAPVVSVANFLVMQYTGARKLCAQPKFIALSIALGIAPSIK